MSFSCAVRFCKNKSEMGIRLHTFPKDLERCKYWVEFCESNLVGIKMERVHSSYLRMCSVHFEDEMYRTGTRKYLEKHAVPTLKGILQSSSTGITSFEAIGQPTNGPSSYAMEGLSDILDTPCNSSSRVEVKQEEEEDVKFNLDELHHSIDIKEDEIDGIAIVKEKPAKSYVIQECPKLNCCEVCSFRYTNKSAFLIHLRTHTGEKPFGCAICDYKCATKAGLTSHLKTHTGEKPFACSICDYKSAYKSSIKRHLITHTGEKPFSCEICNLKCVCKAELLVHSRTHTGEKPFVCDICGYKFIRKSSLKLHLKNHRCKKAFACELCDYKCARKSSLKLHLGIHT